MKRALVLAAVLAALLSSGCHRTVYKGENLAHFATLNGPGQGEAVVEHFLIKKWNHYFLGGLVPTAVFDVSDVLGDKVHSGQAVRNLSIRHQVTFGNGVVAMLAMGGLIYSPMTTVIEGDIVSINSPGQAPPAQPAAVQGRAAE